jgi:hypothetical protein
VSISGRDERGQKVTEDPVRKSERYTPPPVFFVRVASKGLTCGVFVRVANKGDAAQWDDGERARRYFEQPAARDMEEYYHED